MKHLYAQLRLLLADWCLGLALELAGHYWSNNTLLAFKALADSIGADLDAQPRR